MHQVPHKPHRTTAKCRRMYGKAICGEAYGALCQKTKAIKLNKYSRICEHLLKAKEQEL